MVKRFALITLIILSAVAMPFAQPARTSLRAQPNARDFSFQHLTIDDGLSQGMVFAIHQDRQGFIELLRKNYHNREDFKRQNNGSAE